MSKYKMNGNGGIELSCGPSKKRIKAQLVELEVATNDLLDLMDAGYLPYQHTDLIFGNLYLRKRQLNRDLEHAKK